jgi:transposase
MNQRNHYRLKIHNRGTVDKIVAAIQRGCPSYIAAQCAGIHRDTLRVWLNRGREEKERLERPNTRPRNHEKWYLDLYEKVEQAKGMRVAKWLESINIDESWQSKAWLLERCYRNDFGRQVEVSLTWRDVVRQQGLDPDAFVDMLVEKTLAGDPENMTEV